MPDNQTIKKDKKYKFTPLEKRFIKIYLLLAVLGYRDINPILCSWKPLQ
jgi:hypothetical protein